jgi:SAM-dependent methyltransferase
MISVRLAKWYLSLMPVTPPAFYEHRKPLERALMEYASELNLEDAFLDNFPGLVPSGDILDIGCGFGGRTVQYKELGAKSVTGLEVQPEMVAEARAFAESRGAVVTIVEGCGEAMPFSDSSFDSVYSYDVFEHVTDLLAVLRECFRVLRPGGTLYVVFPPIHHPTGGSHFHGYLSKSPAPNLFFRPKTLIAAAECFMDERGQTYRPELRPGDYLPTVNGTTTRLFLRYVNEIPFSKREIHFPPIRSQKAWFLNPVFALGCRVPLLREISTHRIVAKLTK